MRFAVTNTDSQPFSFTSALHTYFRVMEVSQVSGGDWSARAAYAE